MADAFFQVILPLKLRWIPTYSAPTPPAPGQRVCVELSGRRYDGVVWRCLEHPDLPPERIQPVITLQHDLPQVTPEELRFWQFLATYYLCTPGEVYKAAYPLLKLRSEHTAADIQARLRLRLQKKEEQLAGRHTERVAQRLRTECEALRAEIAAQDRSEAPAGKEAVREPGSIRVLTGSGRIPAYKSAVREALDAGRQVLVLSPEIAFCQRLEAELAGEFAPRLHIFHSGKTPAARRQAADVLRRGTPAVILGTRSALFLPFRRLGLIIVDEEQDPAYKQGEPAPRYHGRDAAIALAGIHGARVLLGTATPSLETLFNLRVGKYLPAAGTASPATAAVQVIDIAAERRKNGMNGLFSRKLADTIRTCPGPVLLLRGWEKPDQLAEEAATLFPGQDIRIKTLGALKREGAQGIALLAVLQADALISREDFRADERAIQIAGTLCLFAPQVILQTGVPARFNGSRGADDLLSERKTFGFPPYTRLVDVRRQGSGELLTRHFLPRDPSLAARKQEIYDTLPPHSYPDVDPA